MKKILITGSRGFIGRNLKEELEENYQICAPTRQELDLSDTEKTKQYLKRESFDVVIHCANTNNTRFGVGAVSDYEILNKNLRMYWNLAQCADLCGQMYYFGSGAEYDAQHYIPNMTEDYFGAYIPQDPYGFSKYVMNQNTRKSDNIYNLRLFGVYGKYEEWNRRFISNNMCRVLRGLDISINQDMEFDYLNIGDLCGLMPWFIEHTPKHHDYNVCTGIPVRLSEIAAILREQCGSPFPVRVKCDREKLPYTADNSRLLGELGPWNFTDISLGIAELWAYYRGEYRTKSEFYQLLCNFSFN